MWAGFKFVAAIAFAFLAFSRSAVAEPATMGPMQFVHVVSSDSRCAPNCPEWISAQGKIEIGTAAAFQKVMNTIGARRLPILISSPGGSTTDAITMGRLIRSHRLAVAVASTTTTPCANPKGCATVEGLADSYRAYCASACTLVLAGGVERYASPFVQIGVHQTLTQLTNVRVLRQYRITYRVINGEREEISRELINETRTKATTKQAAAPKTENANARYLREMGITPDLEKIALTTPPAQIRWLTADEKRATNLVTIWIDQRLAMLDDLTGTGLTGVPVSEGHASRVIAHGAWPFALPVNGHGVALSAEFAYRRGGGGVVATLSTANADPQLQLSQRPDVRGRGFKLTLQPGGAEVIVIKAKDVTPWRETIGLSAFCVLQRGGKIAFEPYDVAAVPIAADQATANPTQPPIVADASKIDGMPALLEEACAGAPPIAAK